MWIPKIPPKRISIASSTRGAKKTKAMDISTSATTGTEAMGTSEGEFVTTGTGNTLSRPIPPLPGPQPLRSVRQFGPLPPDKRKVKNTQGRICSTRGVNSTPGYYSPPV